MPTPEAPARALRDLVPGGLGGHPHAGHAPRGRARAAGAGGRGQAGGAPEAAADTGHAHCLSFLEFASRVGGDPGPVREREESGSEAGVFLAERQVCPHLTN